MPDPKRNAAIYYLEDGFNPQNGLNGRRMAGQSFLKGFFDHADVDEFIAISNTKKRLETFVQIAKKYGVSKRVKGFLNSTPQPLHHLGAMFIPTPNYYKQAWERLHFGMESYSLCGLTHTISSPAFMDGMFNLRVSPQAEWDAIICTSQAVHSAIQYLFETADDFLSHRFGSVPPRPQLPVVPLGIHAKDFYRKPEIRHSFRQEMGWTEDDIVVSTVARLSPYSKFDPLPLFIALQQAQKALGSQKRLHMVACSYYADPHSKKVFEDGAAALMPDVGYHYLDGDISGNRDKAYSGADIAAYPIDNTQESFGLAPIEAMAAGLPVIASDWDGLRDTVSPDVGIRVPTLSTRSAQTAEQARLLHLDEINFAQYSGNLSAQVEINLPLLIDAIIGLASNESIRKRMGDNGIERVKTKYDWSVVVPQMQEVWAHLAEIRSCTAPNARHYSKSHPIAPPPMAYLSTFPTHFMPHGSQICKAVNNSTLSVEEMFKLRRYAAAGHRFETCETISAVLTTIVKFGVQGVAPDTVAGELKFNALKVENAYCWLLKYGFIVRV